MFGGRRMILRMLSAALPFLAACSTAPASYQDPLYDLSALGRLCLVPQVGIFGDTTTILARGTIYYRRGTNPWAKSSMQFSGAHALTRLPDGGWLIAETGGDRLVQVDDLSGNGRVVIRSELAGYKLNHPHYALVDPKTGYVYVVDNELNGRLFRFKSLEGPIEVWIFPPEDMGYARSLSWFDGHIHVILSSRGQVLRIDDYARHLYTRFSSPRPANSAATPMTPYGDFPAGALAITGLVLNSVQKNRDWYYGSNDFLVEYAFGGDTRPARLIRWRTWVDFQRGNWEDLSSHIPVADIPLVPYFLTIHNDVLYTPLDKKPEATCESGQILRLNLKSLPST
jgi:hypothetical protein